MTPERWQRVKSLFIILATATAAIPNGTAVVDNPLAFNEEATPPDAPLAQTVNKQTSSDPPSADRQSADRQAMEQAPVQTDVAQNTTPEANNDSVAQSPAPTIPDQPAPQTAADEHFLPRNRPDRLDVTWPCGPGARSAPSLIARQAPLHRRYIAPRRPKRRSASASRKRCDGARQEVPVSWLVAC
jgi:hypothetical protein